MPGRRGTRGHNEACRQRAEKLLADDPKFKEARSRIDDYLAKTVERQEAKKARKEGSAPTAPDGNAASSSSSSNTAAAQGDEAAPTSWKWEKQRKEKA